MDSSDNKRATNQKFIARLMKEGWRRNGDLLVHPSDEAISILLRSSIGEFEFSPKYIEVLQKENAVLNSQADPSIYEMKIVRIVEDGLRQLPIPPVTRPPLGPNDPATEDLVCSTLTYHVYSEIAHIRTILAGFLALLDIKNVPSGWILSRHVFEWTSMACYLAQSLKGLMSQKMWQQAFDVLVKATTGNQWAKNHGHTYETLPFPDEIDGPIGTNNLVAAYAKHQKRTYNKGMAFDTYSLLSEHSHPGAACLAHHRDWVGSNGITIEPPTESSFGGINGFVVDWLMVIHELLGLAKEERVRPQLVSILVEIARIAKTK